MSEPRDPLALLTPDEYRAAMILTAVMLRKLGGSVTITKRDMVEIPEWANIEWSKDAEGATTYRYVEIPPPVDSGKPTDSRTTDAPAPQKIDE